MSTPTSTSPNRPAVRTTRPGRSFIRASTAIVGLLAAVTVTPALAAPPTPAPIVQIEYPAPYDGQDICSPTAKPGVAAFADMLIRTYPGTSSLGIVRACSIGGTSEHKEGRAFDWALNAYSSRDVAYANDMVNWLQRTDSVNNTLSNARRLGVMYVIFNKKVWRAYRPADGWTPYTGPSAHTDHMHISFSWPGAEKLTSYWTGKTYGTPAPPPPVPQLTSGTSAPVIVDSRVPSVQTPFALVAGKTYRITVKGTYAYGSYPYQTADAECNLYPSEKGRIWHRLGSKELGKTTGDFDMHADSLSEWRADNLKPCDSVNHTYSLVGTPSTTRQMTLGIKDTKYHDNTGKLAVTVSVVS